MLGSHSFKAILQRQLEGVARELEGCNCWQKELSQPRSIPIYRLKSSFPIVYRCAIAKQVPANADEFARKIVQIFPSQETFTVEISRSPWIDFRLCDRALAMGLNELLTDLVPSGSPSTQNNTLALAQFNLYQYAHARCLSVLYSASRSGLISLSPTQKCLYWQWQEPASIPWLCTSQWRLQYPVETALITNTIDLCDRAFANRIDNWEKAAFNIGEGFLACDRACRIWGQPLDLARARLGLFAVAQRILSWILQEKLLVVPMVEC